MQFYLSRLFMFPLFLFIAINIFPKLAKGPLPQFLYKNILMLEYYCPLIIDLGIVLLKDLRKT